VFNIAFIPQDLFDPCFGDSSGFDISKGTMYAHSVSGFGGCSPDLTVEDDFVVSGLPAGTLVQLVAHLDLSLSGGCILGPGYASASIREGLGPPAAAEWDVCELGLGGGKINTSLTVFVSATAGVPFRMRYTLGTNCGEAQALLNGAFSFDGLPANAVITSCNGFVEGPVQVRTSTWGRIKGLYR